MATSKLFNYHTVTRTLLADLYTPVGIYMHLRDVYPQSVLMESSDYHESNNSRSFICVNPMGSVAFNHGFADCAYPDGSTTHKAITDDYPSEKAINDFLHSYHVEGDKSQLVGMYGYTSFNAVRYFEHIAVKDSTAEKNDAPDLPF